jgi:hypothetical protein
MKKARYCSVFGFQPLISASITLASWWASDRAETYKRYIILCQMVLNYQLNYQNLILMAFKINHLFSKVFTFYLIGLSPIWSPSRSEGNASWNKWLKPKNTAVSSFLHFRSPVGLNILQRIWNFNVVEVFSIKRRFIKLNILKAKFWVLQREHEKVLNFNKSQLKFHRKYVRWFLRKLYLVPWWPNDFIFDWTCFD